MKRAFSLILVFALALVAFAGCGGGSGSEGSTAEESSAADAASTDDASVADDAPSAEDAASTEDGQNALADKVIVGVIHITNPAEGTGYTYTHDLGIQAMQKNLGLADDQIIRKNNVNDTDPTAIESAMRECIEGRATVIFATRWGYMETC